MFNKLETKLDFNKLVDEHADYLFRFAKKRLNDESKAEDAVQETFLAAVKTIGKYEGKSSPRTWLTAILKNKLIDFYRKNSKEETFVAEDLDYLETSKFFDDGKGVGGVWNEKLRPNEWNISPHQTLENKNFHEILDSCVSNLPDKLAKVFTLRELNGIESDEVCEILNISPNNFWVMMHRARLGLRRCIEIDWFQKGI